MSCWFCSVREAEDDHALKIEMYGDIDTRRSPSQTQVAYNVRHIDVPRCADCHSRHQIVSLATIVAAALTVILIAAVLCAVFEWVSPWIWAIAPGLSFGLVLGMLAVRFVAHKSIFSVRQAKANFPEIRGLLEKNYRFGRQPKGSPPESSQPNDVSNENQPPAP